MSSNPNAATISPIISPVSTSMESSTNSPTNGATHGPTNGATHGPTNGATHGPIANNNNNVTTNDNKDNGNIEAQRAKGSFRYVEDIAPGLKLDMDLHTILHTETSDIQQVQIIESYFGRTLVTDGKTQSAEHDEFVYHESLVHPAMFWSALLAGKKTSSTSPTDDSTSMASTPKSVFIGGGGELATAREVLRHTTTLTRLVMVDIDPTVMSLCRRYLPEWGGDAVVNHPKMELIVGDAYEYLMNTKEKFDVIIMDISDPIEAGPGIALYTKEFYGRAKELLKGPHGVFVTQAGSADFVPHPHAFPEEEEEEVEKDGANVGGGKDSGGGGGGKDTCCFGPIKNTLSEVFDHAIPYTVPVASFGEDWGFVMAFDGDASEARRLADLPHETIDELIEERIGMVPGVPQHRCRCRGVKRALGGDEKGKEVLKHYDGIVHRRLFALSKPLREAMKGDKRVMTKANPIFMY